MTNRSVKTSEGKIHLVVGLGMSGIGAARSLDEAGEDWLAIEAKQEPGGWAQSRTVNEYRLDYGPHIMLDFDADLLRWMALGEDIRVRHHRSNSVFFCDVDGHPVPVHLPLGDNAGSLPDIVATGHSDQSVPNYLSYLIDTFGFDIAARFLIPYDRKRLCVDLETLPPKWNRRVLPACKANVGESSYLYPENVGVGALSTHLLKVLDQRRLLYDCKLVRLSLKEKRAWLSDGSSVEFASLYSSLPLPELLRLLEECPFSSREIEEALPYASSDIIYLALRENWTRDYDFARIASNNIGFHRLTVLSAYSDHCCPPGEALLMLEAGRVPGAQKSLATDPKDAIRQLIELGMITPDAQLAFTDTASVEHSAIIMNADTPNFVARAHNALAASDVHLVGKFGRWEDMLMGRALRSGISAVRQQVQGEHDKETTG
ncbi:NAD(P)/FAD-dependent oxidoreductase [Parasedimentitalea marina]|uniref:NAD(P)/FAD-dependent oxidoreductase n=1 Tax=Parasedimentitalea marina TaxID=2483033 RepID=A0A3T0N431_9RHOB|nr:NAD(P)/FAD-dependent oxidoreductase [Parasedimentitalea marina]AZV78757.1 NAD(P)/FAD-dependent oxidoreductase [Parasedimentitalea marina]